jgi:hypothetical protein
MSMNALRYRSRRFVIRHPSLDDGRSQIEGLAQREGWPPSDVRVSGGIDLESVWQVRAELTFHHVQDAHSRIPYVEARGSDRDEVRETLAQLKPDLDVYSSGELLAPLPGAELLGEAPREPVGVKELEPALLRAGLGAPLRFSEDFFVPLMDALESPEAAVRQAALWAVAYTEWPQWRAVIEPMTRTDPAVGVATLARQIVELFDETPGHRR